MKQKTMNITIFQSNEFEKKISSVQNINPKKIYYTYQHSFKVNMKGRKQEDTKILQDSKSKVNITLKNKNLPRKFSNNMYI